MIVVATVSLLPDLRQFLILMVVIAMFVAVLPSPAAVIEIETDGWRVWL